MSKATPQPQFQLSFLCPKYWGIWLGIFALRLLALIPYRSKFPVGNFIGNLFYKTARSRRELATENIRRAFPEKDADEIQDIAQEHFRSLGVGLMEMSMNLWGDHRKNKTGCEALNYATFIGAENLDNDPEYGILILKSHFTSLEMTGLLLSFLTPYRPIYRPHDNALMEYLITTSRTTDGNPFHQQHAVHPIPNTDTKTMIKTLRNKQTVLILPDQRYRSRGSIKVPFFGQDAPSNPGICKLAKLGNAKVVPIFTVRKGFHYEITVHPALENFPSGDDYQDTLRLHQLYEVEIRKNPAQYLWTHNRWDIRPGRDY